MATKTAFIRTTKTDKSKSANVRFRLRDGRTFQLNHKSDISVLPERWDGKKQKIKERVVIDDHERKRFNDSVNDRKKLIEDIYLMHGKGSVDTLYTGNKPFARYKVPSEKYGTPFYLTMAERNDLYNFDLSTRPALERQRDIFIFQCVIGCRVGDLYKMTKSSVIDGAIEYIAEKTKGKEPRTIRVPLNSIATEIVSKYTGLDGDRLLPLITEQKYNEAIKEVFAVAGITRSVTVRNKLTGTEEARPLNEVASSHLARRTFCGNLYKKVRDPNLVVALSGHADESKAFARYRYIDEEMKTELVKMLE